ncbi:MAG TPA: GNAT family N-acetyltransferase [Acidimicrobiales bacterium]|nr:GNAT family N-acetyltransferase [Acidimicrobiales bacterium]
MEATRPVQPPDLDRCALLLAGALGEFGRHRGGAALWPLDPAALLSTWTTPDPDRAFLVGTFDSAVVGLAAGVVDRTPGRPVGRIECCYVEPEARCVGVGAALAAALSEWFASRECDAIDAIALPGDRATKQLLEAAGFKTRLLVLRRSLR